MAIIAQEEMSHFEMLCNLILKRDIVMSQEGKDEYVRDLDQFFPKGGSRSDRLVHKLLYAALIEARSCERFCLLSESLLDKSLQKFYRKLMIGEAHHYTLFLKLARQYGENLEKVNKKWESLLRFEATLIKSLGKKKIIHG